MNKTQLKTLATIVSKAENAKKVSETDPATANSLAWEALFFAHAFAKEEIAKAEEPKETHTFVFEFVEDADPDCDPKKNEDASYFVSDWKGLNEDFGIPKKGHKETFVCTGNQNPWRKFFARHPNVLPHIECPMDEEYASFHSLRVTKDGGDWNWAGKYAWYIIHKEYTL